MRNFTMILAAGLMLAACEGPEGPAGEAGPAGADGADGAAGPAGPAGADGADGMDGSNGANGARGDDGDDGLDGSDGSDGTDGTDGTNGTDGVDGSDGADGADAGDFTFRADDASAYTRVDRMGMPAINTAVVTHKDDFNAGEPIDDFDDFGGEIVGNLQGLHAALDDDLTGLNFTPCTVPGDLTGTCVAAAAPLVFPDTLKLNLEGTTGFPNGRGLVDKTIDVTLAVVLLEVFTGDPLNPPAHTAADLVGMSQGDNDGFLLSGFPYLGAPH